MIWATVSLVLLTAWGASQYSSVLLYHQECVDRQFNNARMLRQEVCTDPKLRVVFEAGGQIRCTEMERENRLGPVACTALRVWEHGGPARVWDLAMAHPFFLYAAAIVLLALVVYLRHTRHRERDQRDDGLRAMKSWMKILQPVRQIRPPADPPMLQYAPMHRARRQLPTIGYDDDDDDDSF